MRGYEEEVEDYLQLRQRLKDSIRRKRKQHSAAAAAADSPEKKLPYNNNFGSFFGPSQPSIALRVIHESKSLLENKKLLSKISSSSSAGQQQQQQQQRQEPKQVNEIRKKELKELKINARRDYSFLSDDAPLVPAPPPTRKIMPDVAKMEKKISQRPPLSSKPQGNKPPPPPVKKVLSETHMKSNVRRPKKKQLSEDEKALRMVRNMFKSERYNPVCDEDEDDDVSDMEANWDEIMQEEERSGKIAKKEDEEQLKLIEEEERQERMRRAAKKRKL